MVADQLATLSQRAAAASAWSVAHRPHLDLGIED
jgi:hypothetical protein